VRFTDWLKQNNVELTDAQQSLAKRIDHSSSEFACVSLLTGPGACRNKLLLHQWLVWRKQKMSHLQEIPGAITQEG
jgi:hypothetical protein